MNSKQSRKKFLHCTQCGYIGLEDLILRDDDVCHCLECDSSVIKWADLADSQKEKVNVPCITTTKLAFTNRLADVFLELADMPAKEMRANLKNLALVLNQLSAAKGVTQ